MEFWDQRDRDGKTAEEIPAFGECKESAGAGCLEVGPGMCQLLQEPREGAGNPGVRTAANLGNTGGRPPLLPGGSWLGTQGPAQKPGQTPSPVVGDKGRLW